MSFSVTLVRVWRFFIGTNKKGATRHEPRLSKVKHEFDYFSICEIDEGRTPNALASWEILSTLYALTMLRTR